MEHRDMIDDLLQYARQSNDSVDFGAAVVSASLQLERIIDQILLARRENG